VAGLAPATPAAAGDWDARAPAGAVAPGDFVVEGGGPAFAAASAGELDTAALWAASAGEAGAAAGEGGAACAGDPCFAGEAACDGGEVAADEVPGDAPGGEVLGTGDVACDGGEPETAAP
jgi:hypothetical protein